MKTQFPFVIPSPFRILEPIETSVIIVINEHRYTIHVITGIPAKINTGFSSVDISIFFSAAAVRSIIMSKAINPAMSIIAAAATGESFLASLSALSRMGFIRIQDFIALSLDCPRNITAAIRIKPIISAHIV